MISIIHNYRNLRAEYMGILMVAFRIEIWKTMFVSYGVSIALHLTSVGEGYHLDKV